MPIERRYAIASGVVAFIAWAYLTDWLPQLRFVPHAFFSGALAALLAGASIILTTARPRTSWTKTAQQRHAPATLAFTNPSVWEEEKAALKGRGEYRRPTIFPEAQKFSKQVDGLLDLILRDFVTSWYGHISKRPLFQNEVDRCIRSALLSVTARLTELDLVELGIAQILPVVTAHMREFYDAERAVRGKALENNVTESEELSMAIAGKYRGGKLHYVAALAHSDTTTSTQEHMRRLIEKILPSVLPMNMKSSPAVTVLVRELVACAVLGPILNMLADPDFWNQQIVKVGGAMLRDRKSVRKIRAALDQHAPASPGKPGRGSQFPRMRPYDSERQFERFIRAVRHVSTLNDARLFRSQVSLQLRRDAQVEGQDVAYIRRLETGRRLLDQKIASLSVSDEANPALKAQPAARNEESTARKRQAPLREIIYDAAGLSYFMEYMDRQDLMRLVQFYLVVDGFRNPLEGDNDEPPASLATDPDRMDVAQMYAEYLSKPELQTPSNVMQIVKSYVKAGSRATAENYIAARREVLRMQTRVYNIMKEKYYEAFKRTDLYYKWIAIEDQVKFGPPLHGDNEALSSSATSSTSREVATPPSHSRRPQPGTLQKEPELRRAVLSTSDLKAVGRSSSLFSDAPRRSLDDGTESSRGALFGEDRSPLFGEETENEGMMQSMSSLKSYDSDGETARRAQEEARAVREMQAALDNIVSDDRDKASLFSEADGRRLLDEDGRRGSSDILARPTLPTSASQLSERGKPSLSSLGLVGGPSNRGVFVDDLFAHEQEKFAEDEREDSNGPSDVEEEKVEEAAAGDLGLAEAIDVLNADIERLSAQRNVLKSLSAKAELTNNQAELRILRKSEQSLQREIKRKEMQKQQYIVQESDNSLFGRAFITIKSVMVGKEDDGHEYALYVVEIHRQAGEQMPAATWSVTRRYSQFHELHKRLKARFPAVRELDFPRRQTLFTLQKDFIQKRRATLEKYLRSLLLAPAICRSRELRAFLSQSAIATNGSNGTQADAKDFVTRIYNSVSDGMEEFLGNIPVLDQLSVAGQNLISAATSHVNGTSAIDSLDPAVQDPATATEAEAELDAYEAKEVEPFVKPICDLFLETFELAKGNSWLRGRTVVVVLHQLLGGTIERKVKEATNSALQDGKLAGYVETLKSAMWPDGKMRLASVPRTSAEKARTRKEAGLLLGALIPDIAGSVVGRANAQAAGRKIVAMLNNPRLNVHLVFTLVDEIISIVFPEVVEKKH
ncbi:Putative Phox-associated domain, sorting nexin, RGS domain, RGS domain superfamily, RGS, subdomain 2 [Septoria linicola]|uniref:Phox-associated domain, sorting nexin, RGS domain, RGS domain superfamily, RGS, subdomain 2 n=1 Tax=Septoria linicola TaxID=215465 RepID=A0A9Q9AKL1_9PEZI|nr:putative Phox-associated domain, sorting nexin, RGS domain, RGS domain superfamily, RGS, subdomain 2 [Septoria linicola]USW47787.1 Putative Phox-associated domain, sorting nexin, RGS domain, RGS domain superfamily, RGS, subdomain 2 [Septoria linicola]